MDAMRYDGESYCKHSSMAVLRWDFAALAEKVIPVNVSTVSF